MVLGAFDQISLAHQMNMVADRFGRVLADLLRVEMVAGFQCFDLQQQFTDQFPIAFHQ
jgi:hypothetical protein